MAEAGPLQKTEGSILSGTASTAEGVFPHPVVKKRAAAHVAHRKDHPMVRDSLAVIRQDRTCHVVAEDYSYKSEAYYTILDREQAGEAIRPSSRDVLDAFVVPVCLERARRAGIPVVDWGISQAYVPLPAILYGINYFATATDYAVVRDSDQAKDVIKHITNKGKYPFCYQKIDDSATISTCTAVFGKTAENCGEIAGYAEKLYSLFSVPLVNMVFVRNRDSCALSSLAPIRYTRLSPGERAFLAAYRDHQVTL